VSCRPEQNSAAREAGAGISVRGTGRKRASYEFWDSAERQSRAVPVPVEAESTESPTDLEIRGKRVYISGWGKTENGNSGRLWSPLICQASGGSRSIQK